MTLSTDDKKNQPINTALKVGLLVNPYAGIGGEAALKGSDGVSIRNQALAYSSTRRVDGRMADFFQALNKKNLKIDWFVAGGSMGLDYCQQAGVQVTAVEGNYTEPTSAADTMEAAELLMKHSLDLLIFVGGDGTARNIVDVMQKNVALPCLGLPSGVKMQSGVFALSPFAAAEVVASMANHALTHISAEDVRDIDEDALRQGRVSSQYYGELLVPAEPRYMQNLKQGGIEHQDWVLDDIAEHLTTLMTDDGDTILVGPGSTTAFWMATLGLCNTLIGFDLVKNGELLACDLTAKDILQALDVEPALKIVLSPTGHQGFLIGRGNQQLNVEVLQRISTQQLLVIASKEKLKALNHRPLMVDCNSATLDQKFSGFIPIITALNDQVLYPVNSTY